MFKGTILYKLEYVSPMSKKIRLPKIMELLRLTPGMSITVLKRDEAHSRSY